MKKGLAFLLIVTLFFGFSGVADAYFGKIGTANYGGTDYNLIYEGELGGQGLVWLDYTKSLATWGNQVSWASNLGFTGAQITLDAGYTSSIDWGTGWRLSLTDESQANLSGGYGYAGPDGTGYHNYRNGYNMVNSEMGHLYYESLGNKGRTAKDGTNPQLGWGLTNNGDFNNLQPHYYWSGTEYSPNPNNAWNFYFYVGIQNDSDKDEPYRYALAVHPGEVTYNPVPIPGAIWLLASGLVGLVGLRRKLQN